MQTMYYKYIYRASTTRFGAPHTIFRENVHIDYSKPSAFTTLLHHRLQFYRGADKSLARPDWKNNLKVAIFRPTRRSLLPR